MKMHYSSYSIHTFLMSLDANTKSSTMKKIGSPNEMKFIGTKEAYAANIFDT